MAGYCTDWNGQGQSGNPWPGSGMLYTMENAPFEFAFADYILAPKTLYNIGGPARWALLPRTASQVEQAYDWMMAQDAPRLILGGGSNMLIQDEGFPGVVLLMTELNDMASLDYHRYSVGAGVELDTMVREIMLPNNYDVVGGLTGIPGSVGGAIYMNAGTVNGSTCQLLESVDVLKADGVKTIAMKEDLYDYRGQSFCAPGEIILSGTFQFTPAEKDQQAIYDHYKKRRIEKQPQGHCCGSVFKNPEGDHAGRLIEACGLKGTRHGGAIISSMHANFIMNDDNASSDDVLFLIDMAKRTVLETHGVVLEEEVQIFPKHNAV